MSNRSKAQQRPEYIIFQTGRGEGASLTEALRSVGLGKPAMAKKTTVGKAGQGAHPWRDNLGPDCILFPQINVAAANLTEKAHEKLLLNAGVKVFRNELRTISPARRSPRDAVSQDAGPGPTIQAKGPGRIIPTNGAGRIIRANGPGRIIQDSGPGRITRDDSQGDLASYLEGVRDCTEITLARLRGGTPGAGTHTNVAAESGLHWHLAAVGLTPGYRYTGKGVAVAVLDTGLDLTHPDFKGRVPDNRCYDFTRPGKKMSDGNGHGTHCCGLIAASADSSQGRYAVAPDVELWVGKVMSDDGLGYDSDILEGIAWAVSKGVRVISLSLGSARTVGGDVAASYEELARDLFLTSNCLLVSAAGNGSSRGANHIAPVENPAACDSFMAVAAIDQEDRIADFSCGQRDSIGVVNLSAPGMAVFSSWLRSPGGGEETRYELLDGTSMATPIVAAVAALHLESRPELLTNDLRNTGRLWDLLEQTARPLGSPADFGRGCVRVP